MDWWCGQRCVLFSCPCLYGCALHAFVVELEQWWVEIVVKLAWLVVVVPVLCWLDVLVEVVLVEEVAEVVDLE